MRSDRYVDALASGARMSSVDPLSALLGAWRDEGRSKPDSEVLSLDEASAALGAGTQKPPRRSRFGLTVVGAVAAAMLCLGGFGAVVYDAGPGYALYGLRTMLFGDSAKTRTDAVALAAQTELAQVQQLVSQGKWDEAQQRLVTLAPTVQSVGDTDTPRQLVEQYNTLTVQGIERNPQATMPPAGEPLPAPSSGPLTFLTPPPIQEATSSTSHASTSSPSSTPTTTPPSPTASTSGSTSAPQTPSTTSATSTPASSSQAPAPSSAPSSTAVPTSAPTSAPAKTSTRTTQNAPPPPSVTTTVAPAPSTQAPAPPST